MVGAIVTKEILLTPHALPGLLVIRAPYNASLIEHLKNVEGDRYPGSHWDTASRAWVIAKEHLPFFREKAQRLGFLLTERLSPLEITFQGRPDFTSYQNRALDRLSTQRALFLQWEMGLGKTATAICAAEQIPGVCLVIAPQNVLSHWEEQIAKWSSPGAEPSILKIVASKKAPDTFETLPKFVLTSYGMIHKIPSAIAPALIVFDEMHYLIHGDSARSKKCRDFSLRFPHAYRLGLSATPVSSQIHNIYQQLDVLCPHRYGTWFQWVTFYHNTDHDGYEGALQVHGVRKDRFSHLLLRLEQIYDVATKSDAADRLPSVAWQRKSLGAASRASTALNLSNWKNEQQKLAFERASKVREVVSPPAEGKVIFITYLRKTCQMLSEMYECPSITGELPSTKRLSLLRNTDIAVATLRSINEGIELPEFTTVYVVESFPVPLYMTQVLARFVRFGQTAPVSITFLEFTNTSDEIIAQKLVTRIQEQSKLINQNSLQSQLQNTLTISTKSEDFLTELKDALATGAEEVSAASDWDYDYTDDE